MLGVYVHIPFCQRKCNYCAFSSFVLNEEKQTEYVDFLIKEIKNFAKNNTKKVDTIFIGGGTPSLLPIHLMWQIFQTLKSEFVIDEKAEITIECNPNSLTLHALQEYKQMGINRISIGVQSLDDNQLQFIGRLHNSQTAINSIKMAKEVFENVSVDLLIGIKNQQKEAFLTDLRTIASLGVTHISTYMLQVEGGTPLAQMAENNPALLPDDDECVGIYESAVKELAKLGFNQYEVSNFAKEGNKCKHNQKYWRGDEYIGFGLSAHSYINGTRFANSNNFTDYYKSKIAMTEKLDENQLITEHIMLGLRCDLGVDKNYLKSLKFDIEKSESLADYVQRGIIRTSGDKLFLNPQYYGVNNFIIAHLLP
ncbi:MAG: radical SAM family heme chaperone HemW [Clostridia bacterium]|nr:radical SAM family heme chaperone HemW [Clostridia bacterium]